METLAEPTLKGPLSHPDHAAALAWAHGCFAAESVETLSHSSWASSYRLQGAQQTAYLKILPPGGAVAAQVQRLCTIAQHFPAEVPPVIAAQSAKGWVLVQDHGACALSSDVSVEVDAVLRSFAQLQARAAVTPPLLVGLPVRAPSAMVDEWQAFLDGPADVPPGGGGVGLAYFLGAADVARYQRLFTTRAGLLRAQVAWADVLPRTLVHGDLHSGNVAVDAAGSARFIDWDEAGAGVAGMCLHGLWGGSAFASVLVSRLQGGADVSGVPQGRQLSAYVDALVRHGYATRAELLQGLPGALCAGQMRFIASFGLYPGEAGRRDAAQTLRAKLSDLLDLCDWLVSRDLASAAQALADYEQAREWPRALRLAQDQVARQPGQAAALARYAGLCWLQGDVATAEEAWSEVLALTGVPAVQRAQAQIGLARVQAARLDLAAARARLRRARLLAPDLPEIDALAGRWRGFAQARRRARSATGWPQVALTAEERRDGRLAPDTLALLMDVYAQCGAVQVDGVFEPDYIRELQSAFRARYGQHFHDGEHPGALKVGDKRWMLTMRLDEVFGSPKLLASPLLGFFDRLLSTECILSAYTAVISLPGSQNQLVHKDHCALFDEAGWQLDHPSFAAQVVVPLLDLNSTTGATRVFKGTQRLPLNKLEGRPFQDPVVPLGSCLLLDYATSHYGIGNQSDQVRPILNLVFSRPWFRDCRNYYLQPPLRFDAAYLAQAPEIVHRLVDWWDLERRAATLD
jgi:tetratricopeptide (TPR) repeat protein